MINIHLSSVDVIFCRLKFILLQKYIYIEKSKSVSARSIVGEPFKIELFIGDLQIAKCIVQTAATFA